MPEYLQKPLFVIINIHQYEKTISRPFKKNKV